MEFETILTILAGAIAGVLRSIIGYIESGEPFNMKLFLYTLLRTSILGASIGYGLNQEFINVFFQVYFADTLILNKGLNKIKEKVVVGKT